MYNKAHHSRPIQCGRPTGKINTGKKVLKILLHSIVVISNMSMCKTPTVDICNKYYEQCKCVSII